MDSLQARLGIRLIKTAYTTLPACSSGPRMLPLPFLASRVQRYLLLPELRHRRTRNFLTLAVNLLKALCTTGKTQFTKANMPTRINKSSARAMDILSHIAIKQDSVTRLAVVCEAFAVPSDEACTAPRLLLVGRIPMRPQGRRKRGRL